MRNAAHEVLDDGCSLVLYQETSQDGRSIETLVVDRIRAGQWAGGKTRWGRWDIKYCGVRPDDNPSLLLTLNGESIEV